MGIHDRDYYREQFKSSGQRTAHRLRPAPGARRGDWQSMALRVGALSVVGLFVFLIVKALMDRRTSTKRPALDASLCQVVSRGVASGKPERDMVVLDCPRQSR